jgi:hypothetical protein
MEIAPQVFLKRCLEELFFTFKKKTGLRFALMLKTREALSETLHTTKSNYPGWEIRNIQF